MREISDELEKELIELASNKFIKSLTYKTSEPLTKESLKKRYCDWIIDRYRNCTDRNIVDFYEIFRLK